MNTTAASNWRHTLFQWPFLISVAIFSLAILPRLVAVERYITPDELIWIYRSVNFREAIRAGQWADTLLAGHPGVITMWLGALGTSIQLFLNPADREVYQWITQLAWLTPDNMTAFQQLSQFLTAGRLAVAVVNSLGIVLVFWMARLLLGDLFALLVMLFLVLDPFLAGLSGILHVDGLATTFATICLLSLTLSLVMVINKQRSWLPWLYAALSGSTAGLAVLAKSPALLLLPVAVIIYTSSLWISRQKPFTNRLKNILFLSLSWGGSFVAILFLVFPALWTSPIQVAQITSGNASRHVEEALRQTFFLGQVAFDHGLLFYPVALAWRLGPVVVIGLIILLVLLLRPKWRERLPKLLMLVLVLWIVIFLIVLTLAAKKFDRYALPVVPALALLAAIGWSVWLRPADRAKRYLLAALLTLQLIYMVFVLPYPLAAYNLLLGGALSAKYVMPIGWGESISSAGSWLSGQPDVESKRAVSGIAPALAPFYIGETVRSDENGYEEADYVIITANSRQMNPQVVAQSTQDLNLLEIVRYGGLDQAWIYENPRPEHEEIKAIDLPQPVTFGSQMQLLSQGLKANEDEILFSARWNRQDGDDRFLVKLRLYDADGHEWSNLETALLNEVYFYPEYWEPDETPLVVYELDLPAAMPPGIYQVDLSLVDEAAGSQLPIVDDDGTFQGVSFWAGEVSLAHPTTPVDVNDLNMLPVQGATWDEDSLRLVGHGELPEQMVSGGVLNLDLYWQSTAALPIGLQVSWQIADSEPVILPLSRYDSGLWQPGITVHEKYRLQIPAAVDSDDVSVSVSPLFADGGAVTGPSYTLGKVKVQAVDRLFSLPEKIAIPTHAVFEPGILLRGVEPRTATVSAGDVFRLDLFWQTELATEEPITAFVHLVDDQGKVLAQVDRWPGGLPSNIWLPDQVIIDAYELQLPADIEPGAYQIIVGLYRAESGQRLSLFDAAGQRQVDDSFLLPLIVTVQP